MGMRKGRGNVGIGNLGFFSVGGFVLVRRFCVKLEQRRDESREIRKLKARKGVGDSNVGVTFRTLKILA